MERRVSLRFRPIAVLVTAALASLAGVACSPASSPAPSTAVTSTSPSLSLVSQVDPSFSQAYTRLGGPSWLGPAISRAFLDPDLGWRLQVFEFGVLAQDLGSQSTFPLWVNNLLGRQTAPVSGSTDPSCRYIVATGHNVCAAFLSFYETEAAAHLGPPVAEMGLGPTGDLHQDFEYASLDWNNGAVRLTPLGRFFFAARRYDASLLHPDSGLVGPPIRSSLPGANATPGPTMAQATPTLGNPQPTLTPQSLLVFSGGFTVAGPYLAAYQAAGGAGWLGLPLSQPFQDSDLGWQLQVFEFGALAVSPGADGAFLVQINTLLGRQTSPSPARVDPACSYFQASGHNACYQFRTYLQQEGLQRIGLPISEVQEDASGVLYQDFEFVRLEWLNGQVYREASGRLFLRQRGQ